MVINPGKLEVGRQYHERVDHVEPALLSESAGLTGESGESLGLSVAFVLALRTVVESGILPPGAIMLGHTVTWYQPLPIGDVRTVLTISDVDPASSERYRRVVIGYRTVQNSQVLIDQRQEVLWPIIV